MTVRYRTDDTGLTLTLFHGNLGAIAKAPMERFAAWRHSARRIFCASCGSAAVALTVLRSRKFDLIVTSRLSDFDLRRIINLADGADVLVLEALTSPSELLSLVAQRLNRGK